MDKEYLVDGYFNFHMKTNSPGDIKNFIYRILDKEGIDNKNFEITITRISGKGEYIDESAPVKTEVEEPEKKTKKSKVKRKK